MKSKKIEQNSQEIALEIDAVVPRDKTLNIYERLLLCMEAVDYIQKTNGKNNLKYTFASHDAVTSKCRATFVKYGVYPEVSIVEDRLEKILIHKEKAGYNGAPNQVTDSDNYMSYIKIKIKFINVDNPSDTAAGEGVGQGIDDQDKACGKAMSYAYKYALLKALAIETGDDPENDVDFNISGSGKTTEQPRNNLGISPTGALAKGDDMKEVFLESNKATLDSISKLLSGCKTITEFNKIRVDNEKSLKILVKDKTGLSQQYLKIKNDKFFGLFKERIESCGRLSEIEGLIQDNIDHINALQKFDDKPYRLLLNAIDEMKLTFVGM